MRQRRLIEENDTECEISPQMSFLADEVAPSKVEGACQEILYRSLHCGRDDSVAWGHLHGRDDKVCGRDDRS